MCRRKKQSKIQKISNLMMLLSSIGIMQYGCNYKITSVHLTGQMCQRPYAVGGLLIGER